MKKRFRLILFSLISIFITNFLLFTPSAYCSEDAYLKIDYKNEDVMPKHFRKTSDLSNFKDEDVDLKGLSELNISGSSQFSALSLLQLKKAIDTNMTIIDIDLRQESHGLINGNAVSWYSKGDKANAGLSLEEVTKKENSQLASIPFGKEISLDKGKVKLVPTTVENEEKLVSSNGIKYFRITVTDAKRPTDLMVDRFMEFVAKQPENTWLHFHCKHGIGRTTTFMVLYDIIKNSKTVSLDDIVERQVILGGKDILKSDNKRSDFVRNFYKYTKENKDNFKTTWSQWVKENNIEPYTLEDELPKH